MKIWREQATISFSFEPKDWKWYDPEAFLKEFKLAVPSEMRSYNDETKVWDFSRNYEQVFDELYAKHLKDNNTPMLF